MRDRITKVVNTFDAYGTLTLRITEVGTGLSGETVTGIKRTVTESNTVDNSDTADWLIGLVTEHKETAADGTDTREITTRFTYRPNTRDVNLRTDFADTTVEKITTTTRNANGVVTDVTVAAKDIDNGNAAPRTTTWGGLHRHDVPGNGNQRQGPHHPAAGRPRAAYPANR